MTLTARTPAPPGPGTDPLRTYSFLGGLLYLVTFAASIPAAFYFLTPVLTDPGYVLGAGADVRVGIGGLLDLVNALAAVGTAVVLFPVLKRQSEALALGFVTSRLVEATTIVVGVVSLFAVVALRRDLGGPGATDDAALTTVATALVGIRDVTFHVGPGVMVAVNAMLLGTLMYRSRLVPRAIPLMGLVGAPLWLAAKGATLLGVNDDSTVWSVLAVAPIFFWELSLGIWLVLKGFRPAAVAVLPPAPGVRAAVR